MELIKQFIENPFDFLQIAKITDLIKIAKIADTNYYNGTSIMTDQEYDLLIDRIKFLDPNNKYLKTIGAKIIKKKIKLPYFMGSMNKIKPQDEHIINHFINKYKSFCISDKLDGISALLVINDNESKLYTRGDGFVGQDISHLIPCININITGLKNIAIRGEIIISKKKFKKYEKKMANPRNMVSGLINSKKIDKEIVKDLDFVAYEIINPWTNLKEQFSILNKTKLLVVNHFFVDDITITKLIEYLIEIKKKSIYECDGLIISYINPIKRSLDKNPEYAFAFKDSCFNETINVKVISVEWNISKDKYIKPRLILEPTKLSGVVIKYVTGFNAKYIVTNKIGPGTIIELIRAGDVIPHITKIIKSTTEQMPDYAYKWTDTGVDIIYEGTENREHLIKNLTWFCNKMEIADINEANINKFIQAGINSIPKITSIKIEDLEKVSNFKEKMIYKIYNNIQEKIKNIDLLKFMIASNSFGHGIGEKRIKKILEEYPNIIFMYIENTNKIMIKKISEIYGFDEIIAKQFIKNMSNFLDLLNECEPELQEKILFTEIERKNIIDTSMENLKILFSGFRNKKWEEIIISKGGIIVNSISKNTNILVTTKKDIENNKNSKIIKAKELGIKIYSNEEFEEEYIL